MERWDAFFRGYRTLAITLLRVVSALLIMQHGAQKLFGLLGGVDGAGATAPLLSLFGLAGVLEFFVGALVAVGLFTRPAAFLLSGEMAFAYFIAHAPQGFWPVLNGGEVAVLKCFIFFYIAAAGPGPWSLDALWRRSQKQG